MLTPGLLQVKSERLPCGPSTGKGSHFLNLLAQAAVVLHGLAGAEVLQLEEPADLDLALSLMRICSA
jgi:hypothetical protein